jgi:cation:H+ antiporter
MAEFEVFGLVFNVLIIAISFIVLNWASNLAINNAVKVANVTKLGKTAIGFSLIAFATSLPELVVAFVASSSGNAALSIGDVLGSNIVNICIIVGLAAFLVYYVGARRKKNGAIVTEKRLDNIVPQFAKSELSNINFGIFISSLVPLVLIFFNIPSWIIGIVLIGIFIVYMYQISKVHIPEEDGVPMPDEDKSKLKKYLIYTISGALGVVVSSYFLVQSAVSIATTAGLSQQIIGATIVAIGTSLPEITMDIKAMLKGHPGLAFGDVIGSSFVNITLILGVTLLVPAVVGSTVIINMSVFQNLVIFSIITNLFFWYALSKGKIGRREGIIFLFIYALFIATTLGLNIAGVNNWFINLLN